MKKKAGKKIKDEFCGLSELQLKEIYEKLVVMENFPRKSKDISFLHLPLSIAFKAGQDFLFSDFDTAPFAHFINSSQYLYENTGGEKYFYSAGASFAESRAENLSAAVCEVNFELKDISHLSAILNLNRGLPFSLVIILHTSEDISGLSKYFDFKLFYPGNSSAADDYDTCREALEYARSKKKVSVIIQNPQEKNGYLKNMEKALISKNILSRDELNYLKEEILAKNINITSAPQEVMPVKPPSWQLQLSNRESEDGYTFIALNEKDFLSFCGGASLGNFEINAASNSLWLVEEFYDKFFEFQKINGINSLQLNIEHPGRRGNDEIKALPAAGTVKSFSINLLQNETSQGIMDETILVKEGDEITIAVMGLNEDKSVLNEIISALENEMDYEAVRIIGNGNINRIIDSIKKTGKLILISDEKNKTASSELICSVSDKAFQYLDGPLKRIIIDGTGANTGEIINLCKELNSF